MDETRVHRLREEIRNVTLTDMGDECFYPKLEGDSVPWLWESAKEFAEFLGYQVRLIKPSDPKIEGLIDFNRENRHIGVSHNQSPDQRTIVLLHELGHLLATFPTTFLCPHDDCPEHGCAETVAEAIAYLAAEYLGLACQARCLPRIAAYDALSKALDEPGLRGVILTNANILVKVLTQ